MVEMSIVTQCPVCLTQFKVGEGQLNVANGQVRCGACLHVFNARQNCVSHHPGTFSFNTQSDESENQTESPDKNRISTDNHHASNNSPLEYLSSLNTFEIPTLNISTEPVTLQAPALMPGRFAYGWLFACILAALGIAAQIGWFNRVNIYWDHPQYQPLFDHACSILNCQIPPRQSLDQIINQSIRVTPHPTFHGAVEVKLILNNLAEFQQPFPAISLEFSDLKGRLVANRILQPADYLDNQQVDPLAMPVQQPVQVALEVMSPGPRAVNYKLELLASEH